MLVPPTQLAMVSPMVGAISRHLRGGATRLSLIGVVAAAGCGGRKPVQANSDATLTAPKTVPLARALVLETSGPPPSDTTVTFRAGDVRIIVLRHGPPENILFANLAFAADAFADSGQTVQVEIHPRPGVYGLEFSTSLPLRPRGASLTFGYARFFSAPARARQVYGSDAAYQRALAVGRILPDNRLELLPSSRPAADILEAELPSSGSYLVGAAQ
jgi:hypothetical protein